MGIGQLNPGCGCGCLTCELLFTGCSVTWSCPDAYEVQITGPGGVESTSKTGAIVIPDPGTYHLLKRDTAAGPLVDYASVTVPTNYESYCQQRRKCCELLTNNLVDEAPLPTLFSGSGAVGYLDVANGSFVLSQWSSWDDIGAGLTSGATRHCCRSLLDPTIPSISFRYLADTIDYSEGGYEKRVLVNIDPMSVTACFCHGNDTSDPCGLVVTFSAGVNTRIQTKAPRYSDWTYNTSYTHENITRNISGGFSPGCAALFSDTSSTVGPTTLPGTVSSLALPAYYDATSRLWLPSAPLLIQDTFTYTFSVSS